MLFCGCKISKKCWDMVKTADKMMKNSVSKVNCRRYVKYLFLRSFLSQRIPTLGFQLDFGVVACYHRASERLLGYVPYYLHSGEL